MCDLFRIHDLVFFVPAAGEEKMHTYVMSFIYTSKSSLTNIQGRQGTSQTLVGFGCLTVKNKIENTNDDNSTILVSVFQKSMG